MVYLLLTSKSSIGFVSTGFSSDYISNFQSYYLTLNKLNSGCATNRYFQLLGNVHDIEAYLGLDNLIHLNYIIFMSHWGQLALIFIWLSGNIFHIGWTGNYDLWKQNPLKTIPIAHSIFDPHLGSLDTENNVAYSGLYNVLFTIGFSNVKDMYNFIILTEWISVSFVVLGFLHLIYLDSYLQSNKKTSCVFGKSRSFETHSILYPQEVEFRLHLLVSPNILVWPLRLFVSCFDLSGERLNFHIGAMIGLFSLLWSGHLLHHSLPVSRGMRICYSNLISSSSYIFSYTKLLAFYEGSLVSLSSNMDKDNHIWGSSYGAGESVLTLFGGLKPDTVSLYLTDIVHHHLSLGILLIFASHIYSSLYKGFGHRIRDILFMNGTSGSIIGFCQTSLHLALSLACGGLGVLTSIVAINGYLLLPYAYVSYITNVALYIHHQYIASFLMVASLVHGGIFLIRDCLNGTQSATRSDSGSKVGLVLKTKGQLISHLSWVSLYLGFHTLGVYIHNDSVVAFGESQNQLLIEPLFAELLSINKLILCFQPNKVYFTSSLLDMGPGDLLVSHAISLGLHISVLILIKGSLDSRGSKLMPDKINFSLSFACDGPTRGGTCDISAWDSAYLAFFWVLNTDAWLMFYFHWRQLTLFENTVFQFEESSSYLNGWFRDYLWFNSASLLNGYNAFRANDLSCLAWIFLAAHLCWATGFMFLISWRGYWQELVDIIIVMHLKTPILYDIWLSGIYTPVALSIVQARLIGLTHFSVGFVFTYASFVLGSTS